ncbi:MAG: adenylate kinase family protein [Candidatus Thorarchaeota archaeon]|nr:adenylate kinase family protein [Candidatus Thorarchaeota archaeon]
METSLNRYMASILIGGTPGTGKTKVAKVLGSRLSIAVFALGELADKSGCISAQDKARDTGIIDEDCLVEAIIDLVDDKSKRFVIEGHYIDLVPSSSVQWVFILRTHPETLTARLTERGYNEEKVKENVEAEVLGVCQLDALDAFGEERVLEIDTSEMAPPDVASMIEQMMKDEPAPNRIDWMVDLEKEGRLDEFLIE